MNWQKKTPEKFRQLTFPLTIPPAIRQRNRGISVYHYLSITVTCISLIISAFAVTFTDSPFSGRSPLLPCSHIVHFYIHTHLSHAHMPPDLCAAEVCGGGDQTVPHFSFAQNGRQHWCKRVSGYAYTDGLLPKNERHTYRIDYKHNTSDCDGYFSCMKVLS